MLNWLFKKNDGLPLYRRLEQVPTRGLPGDLCALEKYDDHSAWRDSIERDLCQEPPDTNAPMAITFLKSGDGLLQLRQDNFPGPCLLMFSTPLKAEDYARVQVPKEKYHFFCSSAAETAKVVQHFREHAGSTHVALDRCPRCNIITVVDNKGLNNGEKVVDLRRIHQATELARCGLYFDYAQEAARAGDLETARDVALELVGHVTMEDARTHLLLGKLGIAMRDGQMMRDARAFLVFLRAETAVADLDEAKKKKSVSY